MIYPAVFRSMAGRPFPLIHDLPTPYLAPPEDRLIHDLPRRVPLHGGSAVSFDTRFTHAVFRSPATPTLMHDLLAVFRSSIGLACKEGGKRMVKRTNISLESDTLERIDQYAMENHCNRSQAIT